MKIQMTVISVANRYDAATGEFKAIATLEQDLRVKAAGVEMPKFRMEVVAEGTKEVEAFSVGKTVEVELFSATLPTPSPTLEQPAPEGSEGSAPASTETPISPVGDQKTVGGDLGAPPPAVPLESSAPAAKPKK